MQFHEVIPDAVQEHPNSASPSYEETVPPPVIILVAEGNINRDNCHFGNGEDQDDRDDGEKAKDIIVAGFVLP